MNYLNALSAEPGENHLCSSAQRRRSILPPSVPIGAALIAASAVISTVTLKEHFVLDAVAGAALGGAAVWWWRRGMGSEMAMR